MADAAGPPPGTPADFVYRHIRQAILEGRLPPGAVISQVQVATELAVSRSPLREALSRLTSEGLVIGDYNRRARVTELDLDDLDQLYAIRLRVEPVALRATVAALGESELAALGTTLDRMDDAIARNDMASFQSHHRSFHLGLTTRPAGRIAHLVEQLWDHSDRYRAAYVRHRGDATDDRLPISQAEHRAMLEAAAADDVERCVSIHRVHLSRTLNGVFRDEGRSPRWSDPVTVDEPADEVA